MPATSENEAKDTMLGVFLTAWNAQMTVPPVIYDGVATDSPPDSGQWVKVFVNHLVGQQAAIGSRRQSRGGLLRFQLYDDANDGAVALYDAARLIMTAYETSRPEPDTVGFKNIRMRDMPQDGNFGRVDVIAEFYYDIVH